MIYIGDERMRQHGIFARASSLVVYNMIWMMAQCAVAHAQAAPEAAVFVDRAVLAYDERRYEQALQELQEALRLDPDNVDALYYQGLVYIALDRPLDAMAAWARARALQPSDLDVAYQLGTLYFAREQYEQAEPLLRQVYEAEPSRPNLGYDLGFIEYRKKHYRRAIDLFQANVPSDENFAQLTRFYAGLAMAALGFPAQARAEVEEALRLQPISPLTIPAQRFSEALARAAQREGRFQGELRLGLFYDSNVAVVPNASSDIVAQVLRQDRKTHGSAGELGTLNLSYTWLKTLDWEGAVSYRFLQTYNNRLTDFNIQTHTPTLGVAYHGSLGRMPYLTGLQLTYDFTMLGDKKFVQRWIANPYFSLFENAGNLTTMEVRFQMKDFFDDQNVIEDEVRDAVNYLVGPVHFLLFEQGRHYIKMGYQYDFDDTEGNNCRYAGHHFLFGMQYTVPWRDVRLRYDLDFHLRFHTHTHSFLPITAPGTIRRQDREAIHLFSIAKDLMYKSHNFTLSLEYLFDDNHS